MESITVWILLAIAGLIAYLYSEQIKAFTLKMWEKNKDKYQLPKFNIKPYINGRSISTGVFILIWLALLIYAVVFVLGGLKALKPEDVASTIGAVVVVVGGLYLLVITLAFFIEGDLSILDYLGLILCGILGLAFILLLIGLIAISGKVFIIWLLTVIFSIIIAVGLKRWDEKRTYKGRNRYW